MDTDTDGTMLEESLVLSAKVESMHSHLAIWMCERHGWRTAAMHVDVNGSDSYYLKSENN